MTILKMNNSGQKVAITTGKLKNQTTKHIEIHEPKETTSPLICQNIVHINLVRMVKKSLDKDTKAWSKTWTKFKLRPCLADGGSQSNDLRGFASSHKHKTTIHQKKVFESKIMSRGDFIKPNKGKY